MGLASRSNVTDLLLGQVVGQVGIPIPGTTIRVAEDGEILVKGIGVFKRYHANEAANAEAFVDGFFCTGEPGELDPGAS